MNEIESFAVLVRGHMRRQFKFDSQNVHPLFFLKSTSMFIKTVIIALPLHGKSSPAIHIINKILTYRSNCRTLTFISSPLLLLLPLHRRTPAPPPAGPAPTQSAPPPPTPAWPHSPSGG